MELTKSRTITHMASVDMGADDVDEAIRQYIRAQHRELKDYTLSVVWGSDDPVSKVICVITGKRVVGSAEGE